MHMGTPCLVSDVTGCQHDLVTDGETGWVFRHAEAAHLAEKLGAALAAVDRDGAGFETRVTARISRYTYVEATAGLVQAVTAAMSGSATR
jgi:hypothetical protein